MTRDEFQNSYLEKLVTKDKDISEALERAETPRERELLKENLRQSLGHSYDQYAKDYFETGAVGKYLSRFLRFGGNAVNLLGTYTFWSLGPAGVHITAPAAAGYKVAGLATTSLAEIIDGYHYARHAHHEKTSEKVVDSARLVSEGLLEKAVAFAPLAVGEATDLIRGRLKYDKRVTERTLQYAKKSFLKGLERSTKEAESDDLKIVGLSELKSPYYREGKTQKAGETVLAP